VLISLPDVGGKIQRMADLRTALAEFDGKFSNTLRRSSIPDRVGSPQSGLAILGHESSRT